jgi:hypothetical protein
MKKVLELQLSLWGSYNENLSHIVCSPFLIWTFYKQRGVVIQFHIKKIVHRDELIKKLNPKQKK